MKAWLLRFYEYLISGTDRQLFRRSMVLLIILVACVQVGFNTGHWLSYIASFLAGIVYVYVWWELFKRFINRKDQ